MKAWHKSQLNVSAVKDLPSNVTRLKEFKNGSNLVERQTVSHVTKKAVGSSEVPSGEDAGFEEF
jgi:hypothetical protein